MEIREYWAIARRWWWLLVLCTLVGGGSAYVVSRQIEPVYSASALLMVGGSLDVVNPSTGEIQTSQKLAQTYAELLQTHTIRETTRVALDLPRLPQVTVTLLRDTQLLRISVEDTVPQRAADTADELARQLILQTPSAPERQEEAYRRFVQSQLNELEDEIAALSEAIPAAEAVGDGESAARLHEELNVRRANYSSLLSFLKGTSVNTVRIFEHARVPTTPTKPKVMQNTLLACVVGLMLAAGAAFLIEYLDDSVKGPIEIEQILGLATLGSIAEIDVDGAEPSRIVQLDPVSRYAEGYRLLRTNLRYSLPADTRARLFMISSVEPGAGKTTTASNLAVTTAYAGQSTILVDADLRRSDVHRAWGLPKEPGLSSLLVGEVDTLDEVLRTTDVEGLQILPAGPTPPNPAELLGSARMAEVLDMLRERAEVIIFDVPPLFSVSDARVLASLVTGTILVAEVGRTSLQAIAQAAEALKKVEGQVLGVVLNRLDLRRQGYYYNNYYYGYYGYYDAYYADGGSNGDGHVRTKRRSHRRHRRTAAPEAEAHSEEPV